MAGTEEEVVEKTVVVADFKKTGLLRGRTRNNEVILCNKIDGGEIRTSDK